MRKFKIFSFVTTLALCICLLGVGVWAAKTASLTTSGTITFTATNVYAEVSGTIENAGKVIDGNSQEFTATSVTLPTVRFDYTTPENGSGTIKPNQTTATKDWNNNIEFSESGAEITLTFSIINLASRPLYAMLTQANFGTSTNLTTSITPGVNNVITIDANDTTPKTIQIKFKPTSLDDNVSLSYSFNITLSSTQPVIVPATTAFPNLEFTKITGTTVDGLQAVSVKAKSGSTITGTLTIPEKISISGENCIVTKIEASAFENYSGITEIILPESITEIGANAFKGVSVEVFTIPSKVNALGYNFVFSNKLEGIYVKSKTVAECTSSSAIWESINGSPYRDDDYKVGEPNAWLPAISNGVVFLIDSSFDLGEGATSWVGGVASGEVTENGVTYKLFWFERLKDTYDH